MSWITTIKIALTLAAAFLFGLGIRNNSMPLRYAAIAFLVAAVLLRFVRRDR